MYSIEISISWEYFKTLAVFDRESTIIIIIVHTFFVACSGAQFTFGWFLFRWKFWMPFVDFASNKITINASFTDCVIFLPFWIHKIITDSQCNCRCCYRGCWQFLFYVSRAISLRFSLCVHCIITELRITNRRFDDDDDIDNENIEWIHVLVMKTKKKE